jgi:hypothetical protein
MGRIPPAFVDLINYLQKLGETPRAAATELRRTPSTLICRAGMVRSTHVTIASLTCAHRAQPRPWTVITVPAP